VWWTWPWTLRPRALEAGWPAVAITIAGDGVAGVRDGEASRARFSDPFGIAVAAGGTIYVSDAGDAQRIRRLSPDGTVSTFAGSIRGFADGVGAAAQFDTPSGLALDAAGTLYVADTGNNAIRRITPDGVVTTIAGDGVAGYRDGAAAQARFNGPIGVAAGLAGRIIVADAYNDRIRAIEVDGSVVTLAGPPDLNTPCGVAVDAAGNIYVADTGNALVRMIAPTGAMAVIAPLTIDSLRHPTGIAAGASGDIYVTDAAGRIFETTVDGTARIVAGSRPGFADGNGTDAKFRRLGGVAVAAAGRLLVADAGNGLVRLVAARSQIEFRVPGPPPVAPRFDAIDFGWRPLLWPLTPMDGPHEIAGTMGEARGGEGGERFHAGIDVRAEEGTLVRAVRDGSVAAPLAASEFGTLVESVRVGPVAYVHVRVGRDRRAGLLDQTRFVGSYDEAGKLAGIRVKRGARFETGDPIGTVNPFNHVHLNVGWPGEEYNPLLLRLVQFTDTVPPTISRGGVRLFDENGTLLKQRVKGRLLVRGRVQIVVDAWDQVDGNEARRRLGLYALGYEVLTDGGQRGLTGVRPPSDPRLTPVRPPSGPATIVFNRLATDPEAARLVYATGSGIPFYGSRRTRFLYAVTTTFRDGLAAAGVWDTTLLAPGNYTLRIHAADVRGNEALANRDVPVTVTGGS
jgi:sugar lactone lactonase YvrE